MTDNNLDPRMEGGSKGREEWKDNDCNGRKTGKEGGEGRRTVSEKTAIRKQEGKGEGDVRTGKDRDVNADPCH